MEFQPQLKIFEELLRVMESLEADVSVPCVSTGQVIAIINLRDERLREPYSSEEVKLLMSVAAQATITLENSVTYQKMVERDRLATLGEMAAGMAHEIRNPLGSIKGAAQLLDDSQGEGNQEFIRIIKEEVDRLNTVLSRFLDYSRPMKQDLSSFDLNTLLRRTVQLIKANDTITHEIRLELDPKIGDIRSDQELLKQVFINLLINAFQAMPDGGRLTLATEFSHNRERVRIRCVDTGEGIPEKILKNIFIPFYTTKSGGTGLGLAICDRIVRSLSGVIDVRSKVGEGTTFSITLPLPETESKNGNSDSSSDG